MARPAPVAAPRTAPVSPGGGFNFNRDIAPRPAPVPVAPAAPPRAAPVSRPAFAPPRTAPAPAQQRAPQPVYRRAPNAPGNGPATGGFHGRVVTNPRHWSQPWDWNRGIAWQPAPIYWGGGFWGPWAVDSLTAAIAFGAIDDDQAQIAYPSYEVEPDTPGALLLQNYGLQQTPCGPPGLVVIWGPDNSVICAFPNDNVGPGNYELDPTTLTIVSQ
jgi:hypothetical protein